MLKRNDVDDLVESINLDKGFVVGLLQLNHDELTTVLAHIANVARIPTSTFKRARIDLPSFSANWSNFAQKSGLPWDVSVLTRVPLETFNSPRYRLSPSLHEAMFENSWIWQNVYQEKFNQEREEAGVRILEPYIVPIVALFLGRVIDISDEAIPGSKYSTGEVDHEFSMIGGTFFFARIGKIDANALAQLFLEFLSAAETNKSLDFAGLRIYGVLTDLVLFKFYSYDPTTNHFCFDETIFINTKRIDVLSDMMEVSNKLFSVILSGYIDGLRAIKNRLANSGQPTLELAVRWNKLGTAAEWEAALTLAERCRSTLEEPVTSVADIEKKTNVALELLARSARLLPRASPFSGGKDDPSKTDELKLLAARVTKEVHERYLSEPSVKR